MLAELRVRDFVIIDSLEIEFAAGLNVITGETGAGKSILIDSIALLLGDKADAGMVRAGCARATLEGVFKIDERQRKRLHSAFAGHEIELDGDEVTLGRELKNNGRTVCRINGTSVSQAALREVGELLVDIHGQSEHLSLLRVREHVNLLDDFAGTWDARRAVAARVAELRAMEKEIVEIERNARENARRADMLKFQAEEIGNARLKPGEEQALLDEHSRLANAESIAELAAEANRTLYESGDRNAPAALDNIAHAAKAILGLARFDKQFEEYHKSVEEATAILAEVARSINDYKDGIEFNPKRLGHVESRLEFMKKLKRKYGESIDAVIAYGETAHRELDAIVHADANIAEIKDKCAVLRKEVDAQCAALRKTRSAAAKTLAKKMEQQLDELKMGGAKFEVSLQPREPDSTGGDAIEFMIAPNLGEGLKPLAKVASGGETARLMLSLKAVLLTLPPTAGGVSGRDA